MRVMGRHISLSARFKRLARSLIIHLSLIIVGIIMALPFLWMVSTSFKERLQVMEFPPQWIPNPFIWKAYEEVFTKFPFGLAYLNSFKITTSVVVGTLFSCSLAAYAFAKMRFFGRDYIFIGLLATMMIPFQVILIPMFILFQQIGWLNTHWPLIIPRILSNAFGVFLIRQFFLTIPNELLDAAKVDGCNPFSIYWRIILPLSVPVLATLAILTFVWSWNDFLSPLIYLNDLEKFTVPLMVGSIRGMYLTNWPNLMAASCVALAPMLVIYLIGQRYFIEGIALTGLKG